MSIVVDLRGHQARRREHMLIKTIRGISALSLSLSPVCHKCNHFQLMLLVEHTHSVEMLNTQSVDLYLAHIIYGPLFSPLMCQAMLPIMFAGVLASSIGCSAAVAAPTLSYRQINERWPRHPEHCMPQAQPPPPSPQSQHSLPPFLPRYRH